MCGGRIPVPFRPSGVSAIRAPRSPGALDCVQRPRSRRGFRRTRQPRPPRTPFPSPSAPGPWLVPSRGRPLLGLASSPFRRFRFGSFRLRPFRWRMNTLTPQIGKRNTFLRRSAPKPREKASGTPLGAKTGQKSTPMHQRSTPVRPRSTSVGPPSTSVGPACTPVGNQAHSPLRTPGHLRCPSEAIRSALEHLRCGPEKHPPTRASEPRGPRANG